MLTIDGSLGEGGGQIIRTSLALALITRTAVRLTNVRAGRQRPGLMRQHLTAVRAAAAVGDALVEGDEIGSQELTFIPRTIKAGKYEFAIGSAGSAVLVFQTVLPALLTIQGTSELILEGGTHNAYSPTFDFLAKAFLPHLRSMGAEVEVELLQPGFYPAGGGRFRATVTPPKDGLGRIELMERGEIVERRARVLLAHLPLAIAKRELDTVANRLSWPGDALQIDEAPESRGPGNVVSIEVGCEHVAEVFTGFGAKGIRAEQVAEQAIEHAHKYLASGVPVGRYLADQLILPMALAGGGRFITLPPSLHTRTNIETVRQFIDIPIEVTKVEDADSERTWQIAIG